MSVPGDDELVVEVYEAEDDAMETTSVENRETAAN